MIGPLVLDDTCVAESVMRLQRAAYAVEAQLIGSDAIPQLHEPLEVLQRAPETWIGRWDDDELLAVLAYEVTSEMLDISRLAVAPDAARRGYGEELVRHVLELVRRPLTVVSTGSDNRPGVALYEKLGFSAVGREEVVPGLMVTHFELRR